MHCHKMTPRCHFAITFQINREEQATLLQTLGRVVYESIGSDDSIINHIYRLNLKRQFAKNTQQGLDQD